jgi:hypothetical protein
MKSDDVLLIMLIGHGSFDGVEAKSISWGPTFRRRSGARC